MSRSLAAASTTVHGRYTEGHWVFGGVQRLTSQAFLVEMEQRDARTLLPIIQQFIRPGSMDHLVRPGSSDLGHLRIAAGLLPRVGVAQRGSVIVRVRIFTSRGRSTSEVV